MTWVRFLGYAAFSALGRVYQVVILDKILSLNSRNSGTLLTVLCSPNSTPKCQRPIGQWSEFSAVESDGDGDDDDDDDDDDFFYHQLPIYHHNPADESDDSPSDISYHDNNDKHDNFSSDLPCQEDEELIPHLKEKAILHLKGKVDLMKKLILHLKGTVDLTKKPILHLKVQMDLTLVPVDPMTPIQALSCLQMMKQHYALSYSFPRMKPLCSCNLKHPNHH
jgi:hypothetical protein